MPDHLAVRGVEERDSKPTKAERAIQYSLGIALCLD